MTLSRVDAEAKASAGGFSVGFAPEAFSETLPPGPYSSSPRSRPDASARVGVSSSCYQRDLSGTQRPANSTRSLSPTPPAELAKPNLVVGEITQEYNDEIAAEVVISSDPAEGTQVRLEHTHQTRRQPRSEPVEVPSLIGRTVTKRAT